MVVMAMLDHVGDGVHYLTGDACATTMMMQVVQVEMDKCQQERNTMSKSIGQLKAKGEDVSQVRVLSIVCALPSFTTLCSIPATHIPLLGYHISLRKGYAEHTHMYICGYIMWSSSPRKAC
jgi:hypothetical protein